MATTSWKLLVKNIATVFLLAIISLIILNYTTDIFEPKTIIKNDGDSIELPDNFPDFNNDTNGEDGAIKRVNLYSSFVMTQPMTNDGIIAISRIIKVHGQIKNSSLKYIASVTQENAGNINRRHTVYFYIDSGLSGGHLGAEYMDGIPSQDFYTAEFIPHANKFNFSALPLSKFPNGPTQIIDAELMVNDGESHYLGAFVSTGIYGVLQDMWIEYECETEYCSIEFVR